MAQSGLAYDFEQLEQHYATNGAPRIEGIPALSVVQNHQLAHKRSILGCAAIFVIVISIIAAMLYNNMLLTELTCQIENAEASYAALLGEQELMQVELESKTSLETVRTVAERQLGMSPVEEYQIRYIDLNTGDRVLRAAAPAVELQNGLRSLYRTICTYLGL